MAEQRGWLYELIKDERVQGFRIKTSRWTFEARSSSHGPELDSGSSNIHSVTRWWSEKSDLPDGTLLIGSRPAGLDHLGEDGAQMVKQALLMFLGDQAAGMNEVQVSSKELHNRYLVLAKDAHLAESLLTQAAVQRLLAWPYRFEPLVKLYGGELSIEVRDERLEKPDEVLALIGLGEALTAS